MVVDTLSMMWPRSFARRGYDAEVVHEDFEADGALIEVLGAL